MYRKIFYLKQHTPLIHFQHDQAGAFLRATEVKPRLDAFLKEKISGGEKGSPLSKGLKIGFGHNDIDALNYKLRIRPLGKVVNPEKIETQDHRGREQKFPGFFANMGDKNGKEKKFVFTDDPVEITVMTFQPDLLEIIEQYLAEFWATHNFMTRKSKGFGSFSLIEENKTFFKPENAYFFELNCGDKNPRKEFEKLFERMLLFYRALRSGLNEVRGGGRSVIYFKSLMFQYAKSNGHQWDKRKMRHDLFKNDRNFQQVLNQRTDPEGPVNYAKGEAFLYRDMLGLASSTAWKSYRATVDKEATNDNLARYPSPLTLKPIHVGDGYYEVYVINDTKRDALEVMTGEKFKISTQREKTSMSTPTSFDLGHYLDFVAEYFSNRDVYDYVDQPQNNADWRTHTLNSIFRQLAEQHPRYASSNSTK